MPPEESAPNIQRIQLPPDASVLIINSSETPNNVQVAGNAPGTTDDWSTTFEKTAEQVAEEKMFERTVQRHRVKSNEFMVLTEFQKKAIIAIPLGGLALMAIVKIVG